MPKYQLELRYNNEEKIKERIAIFLDTNIWIDLSENDNFIIKEVKEKLVQLVNNGVVFCPLSNNIFMEFHRQTYDSIQRLFTTIDSLSLNLSIKNRAVLYKTEVQYFINNEILGITKNILRNEIFVPFSCTVSDINFVEFPHSFKHPMARPFFNLYHHTLINWKFSEYMYHMKDRIPQKIDLGGKKFQKEWLVRWELTKGDKNKMRALEEEYIIDEIIKPIFKEESLKIGAENITKMIAYFNEIKAKNENKGKIVAKRILDKCPLIKNTLEILTFAGFDHNRKGRDTDYDDLEIMISSSSYYDVLFSRDKWLYDTLNKQKSKLLTKTIYYKDYSEFNKYLDTLLN